MLLDYCDLRRKCEIKMWLSLIVCVSWFLSWIPVDVFCQVAGKQAAIYKGCYIDGGPGNRLLQGLQQNFPDTLTIEICINYCFERGFAYAGAQYSYECFCSRSKPPDNKKADDNECNAKCVGDQSKACGGNNRLSVHSTGIKETGGTGDTFAYMGCFKDFTNGTRLMNGYQQNFPDNLSNTVCSKLCKNRGFQYAGMEYGVECFCGKTIPSFHYYARDEDCSIRCPGNLLELCGGSWRLTVFNTGFQDSTAPDEAGNYIGCYQDQQDKRSLSGHTEVFRHSLTPSRCSGLCYSMGFLYAGTQNSDQCFCGDEHPNPNQKVKENDCFKPCSGDTTQKCGGDYRNSIRETGIPDFPVTEKYIGCFDDVHNQVLKDVKITFDKTNTPQRCMNICKQKGFKYSGVEYSKECLCGNKPPSPHLLVSGDQCNLPCSGDPLESCGAGWRIAVYFTDHLAIVEPLITPTTTTTMSCQVSETTVNGRTVCKHEEIFVDEFSSPLGNKWKNVVKIADAPDYEFVVFQAQPKNCFVHKNQLVIKPTLFNNTQVRSGSLQLQGCTGFPGTRECGYQAFSYSILPPVISARVNTLPAFTFRYGIVEIKAKLPVGDWLVPELWLVPKTLSYGDGYASGRIRIAMWRGNKKLECNGKDLGYNHLESGITMGTQKEVMSRSITSTVPDNWHDYFHTYTLIWKPDGIAFKIDNETEEDIVPQGASLCDTVGFTNETCSLWNSGSKIAPFDKEFYISLGLSAGNARDFPDDCINEGKPKPWKNLEQKAMLKFWLNKDNWFPTWSEDNSALYIEHIRVFAL